MAAGHGDWGAPLRSARTALGPRARKRRGTGHLVRVLIPAAALVCPATGATENPWPATRFPTSAAMADITLTKVADLAFGELVAGGSAGTVVISPAGARSATGGVALGNSAGAAATSFTVGGTPSAAYSITLPASTSLVSGANTMTVDAFTSNPSGTGTLSGSGTQTLTVGATLQVGANQASGSYSGSFSVTVAYN